MPVACPGLGEHVSPLGVLLLGQAVEHIGGGVQTDPAVALLVVVPTDEFVDEILCVVEGMFPMNRAIRSVPLLLVHGCDS